MKKLLRILKVPFLLVVLGSAFVVGLGTAVWVENSPQRERLWTRAERALTKLRIVEPAVDTAQRKPTALKSDEIERRLISLSQAIGRIDGRLHSVLPAPGGHAEPAALRRLPYPFQHYLTVSSDVDDMTWEKAETVHETIN